MLQFELHYGVLCNDENAQHGPPHSDLDHAMSYGTVT